MEHDGPGRKLPFEARSVRESIECSIDLLPETLRDALLRDTLGGSRRAGGPPDADGETVQDRAAEARRRIKLDLGYDGARAASARHRHLGSRRTCGRPTGLLARRRRTAGGAGAA